MLSHFTFLFHCFVLSTFYLSNTIQVVHRIFLLTSSHHLTRLLPIALVCYLLIFTVIHFLLFFFFPASSWSFFSNSKIINSFTHPSFFFSYILMYILRICNLLSPSSSPSFSCLITWSIQYSTPPLPAQYFFFPFRSLFSSCSTPLILYSLFLHFYSLLFIAFRSPVHLLFSSQLLLSLSSYL